MSNNTPSSTPYGVGIKIKAVPEAKYIDELPAVMGDDSTYYPLVVDAVSKDGWHDIMMNWFWKEIFKAVMMRFIVMKNNVSYDITVSVLLLMYSIHSLFSF